MVANVLSFTMTMTERDVHRAMTAAMLALVTERDTALPDPTVAEILARQILAMATAFSDLSAQLGICPPPCVETILCLSA